MIALRNRVVPTVSKREKLDIVKLTSKIMSASVIYLFKILLKIKSKNLIVNYQKIDMQFLTPAKFPLYRILTIRHKSFIKFIKKNCFVNLCEPTVSHICHI